VIALVLFYLINANATPERSQKHPTKAVRVEYTPTNPRKNPYNSLSDSYFAKFEPYSGYIGQPHTIQYPKHTTAPPYESR
jgi:hypothetical protein